MTTRLPISEFAARTSTPFAKALICPLRWKRPSRSQHGGSSPRRGPSDLEVGRAELTDGGCGPHHHFAPSSFCPIIILPHHHFAPSSFRLGPRAQNQG